VSLSSFIRCAGLGNNHDIVNPNNKSSNTKGRFAKSQQNSMGIIRNVLIMCFLSGYYFFAHARVSAEALPWEIDVHNLDKSYLIPYKSHILRKGFDIEWLGFLRNQTMVFVGDSLTRYQYLSLALFLYRGQWDEDAGLACAECELAWGTNWDNFFLSTNLRLGCHEIIDAYRLKNPFHHRENRYFHHFELNFTMMKFFWGPPYNIDLTLPSHPTRHDFRENCMNKQAFVDRITAPSARPDRASYKFVQDFINTELSNIQPAFLFLNQGLWPEFKIRESASFTAIAQAMKNVSKHPFWKRTTATQDHENKDDRNFLTMVANLGLLQYNSFALTEEISYTEQAYWDNGHFYPFVYREMNIALLQQLKNLVTEKPIA
jgi:hypothetical protein